MKNVLFQLETHPQRFIFIGTLLYTLLVAVLVQFVILPYMLPHMSTANGLLKGGDSAYFHKLAMKLYEQVNLHGWGVWQLRPGGQGPAGMAAAFYVLFYPSVAVMIPVNALFHAVAVVFLFRILVGISKHRQMALLGICPFIFFPTAMLWTTQWHKDGWVILGSFMILWSLMQLNSPRSLSAILQIILTSVLGLVLVWIMRPYLVNVILTVSGLICLGITVSFLISGLWQKNMWVKFFPRCLCCCFVFLVLLSIPVILEGRSFQTRLPSSLSAMVAKLGNSIDQQVWIMGQNRKGFTDGYPGAGSKIDSDVSFTGKMDVVYYLPRALQIALLSPFPVDWFRDSGAGSNFMRRISSVEMIIVYAALLFLPFMLWEQRRNPNLWVVLSFVLFVMIVQALVVANVGTLYRMRFGYVQTVVGIGLMGGWHSYYQVFFKKDVSR